MKTPVLESLFKRVAGQVCNFIKQWLQRSCFRVNFAKFLRVTFLKNTSGGCFCTELINGRSCYIYKPVNEFTEQIKLTGFYEVSFGV